MNSTELLTEFRNSVFDLAEPQMWSQEEILGYMDDAQKMFCRFTGGLADSSTPEITRITAKANEEFVSYDPRILKLRSVVRVSDGKNIPIVNYEDHQFGEAWDDDYGRVSSSSVLTTQTGDIRQVITGLDANKLRVVYIPEVDTPLRLIVMRLPLREVCQLKQTLEVDEQHHRHLILWMKHLAYAKQDAETFDKTASESGKADFEAYCRMVREERERREHKPRLIAYGGL